MLVACGGRASREAGGGGSSSAGTTGDAGAMSAGGTGGSLDLPSTVTLPASSAGAEASATPSQLGPCFRGFTADVGGMQLDLEAFVQAPGDYQGDSIHILYVTAITPDGRTFSASTLSEPFGEIALHVTAVSPRFVGNVQASLYARDDPRAPPLTLSLAFDIAASEQCAPL